MPASGLNQIDIVTTVPQFLAFQPWLAPKRLIFTPRTLGCSLAVVALDQEMLDQRDAPNFPSVPSRHFPPDFVF